MVKISKIVNNKVAVILSIIAILIINPYFLWNVKSITSIVALVLLSIAVLISFKHTNNKYIKGSLLLYAFFYYYSVFIGTNYSGEYLSYTFIMALGLLFLDFRYCRYAFLSFYKIFGILLVISLFFFICKTLGILSFSFETLEGPDGRVYSTYLGNVLLSYSKESAIPIFGGFNRFYGFLNEPGFLGTISSLVIIGLKFNFKKYKLLYAYVLAVFLTFSLSSFLVIIIFIPLYFNITKYLKWIILTCVILVVFFNDLLDKLFYSRFNLTGSGSLLKDNRTNNLFDKAFENFLNSNDIWWGIGNSAHTLLSDTNNVGGGGISSYKALIYNHGIIGFLIYVSIFLLIYFEMNNFSKFSKIYFLIFLITIYHRPNIHHFYYLLIFIGVIMLDKNNNNVCTN